VPHALQLFGSAASAASQPSEYWWLQSANPVAQVSSQWPVAHAAVAFEGLPQPLSQDPQFAGSDCVSEQAPLQQVSPLQSASEVHVPMPPEPPPEPLLLLLLLVPASAPPTPPLHAAPKHCASFLHEVVQSAASAASAKPTTT
jgi:hypothetical protein